MDIIIVDDEKYALNYLTEIVSETVDHANIVSFQSSIDALEWSKKNNIDIAFLDIHMKSPNGIELAKQIQSRNSSTNIIFVTGHSEYTLDAFSLYASDYIMKPITATKVSKTLSNLRNPITSTDDKGLRIQTFGNFEAFYNGVPLAFPRKKAKELLAYLIHKKGTSCTAKEAASILFEDKPYNKSIQKQIQTVFSTMMKILRQIGEQDIIIKKFNSVSVDVKKVNCDYYKFLKKDPEAINQYTGEYMSNYGWAEFTVGYLDSKV